VRPAERRLLRAGPLESLKGMLLGYVKKHKKVIFDYLTIYPRVDDTCTVSANEVFYRLLLAPANAAEHSTTLFPAAVAEP
jgi:hypothetical protein